MGRNGMRKRLGILLTVIAMSVTAAVPIALAHDTSLKVKATKAPIAGDGTTAGAVPDFVLTFANTDPSVDGVGILAGGTIVIDLPDDFVKTSDNGNTAILLQGWQASPRFLSYPPPLLGSPFIWADTIVGNTITLTMLADYEQDSLLGPGPKQVHLLLGGFTNPKAGSYKVGVTITPDPSAPEHTLSGTAKVKITKSTRPSVNIVSGHSGNSGPPPAKNVQYQTVAGASLPDPVGLYLWASGGAAFEGVELVMKKPNHYHLVKDNKTVGHVHIRAPKGASGYLLTAPDPSTLHVGPSVPGHAVQDVGLLITQFTPDPLTPGKYTLTFKMKNGNTQKQYVEVTP
jgi:hypothetical protein